MTTNTHPAPAWDEEAAAEALARALFQRAYPGSAAWDILPVDEFGKEVWRESAKGLLDVVRDHLPVKPGRDTLAAAIRLRHREMGSGVETVTVDDYESADAALDLWPGRSEAEVKAEAWDEAVDTLSRHWEDFAPAAVADLERRNPYRADRLAAEGGADRG